MDSDLASILTGTLAGGVTLSQQRIAVIGESLGQGLGVIQNLGVQYAHMAGVASTVQADDVSKIAGLRTSIHVPQKDA